MATYINPYTDFGFKKLFGEEGNKNLLIDFLNQLLPERHQISELAFQNIEGLPDTSEERKAFFDIHCQAKNGERFIVEMQKAKVQYFKDRSLYYITYPIREQAQRGTWNFQLSAIYFIGVLDFCYEDEKTAIFRRDITLKDQHNKPFYDKLQLTYLQMPAFNKTEAELDGRFDKWAYFLKNLENLEDIPKILNEPIFKQAFQTAKVANFNTQERDEYEKSRLTYIGIREVTITAQKEGMEKGMEKGLQEGLQKGLQKGLEEGLQKGIEKGMEKGMEEKEIQLVLNAYKKGKTAEEISMFLDMEIARIEQIIADFKS